MLGKKDIVLLGMKLATACFGPSPQSYQLISGNYPGALPILKMRIQRTCSRDIYNSLRTNRKASEDAGCKLLVTLYEQSLVLRPFTQHCNHSPHCICPVNKI